MIVAAGLYFFGDPVRVFIEKYLEWVVIVALIGIIGGYILVRHLFH
jgi:hypothetical protein